MALLVGPYVLFIRTGGSVSSPHVHLGHSKEPCSSVASSSSRGGNALPGPKREVVRVIVQECCRDDLVDMQVALLQKYLYESFDLVVVLASTNTTLQASLQAKAAKLNFTLSLCPTTGLQQCYDFSYRQLVSSFTGLVVFVNDDMFLWRPWSVRQYKQQWGFDIAAVVETHNGEYLHPGFHILDTSTLPADIKDMSWGCCDVGASTINWMRAHPGVKLHPLGWSRNMQPDTLAALRLIPLELAALLNDNHRLYNIKADLYLENFAVLHPRGSSNWQGYSSEQNQKRIGSVRDFLEGQLQGRPLTWSDRGASTEKEHIQHLLAHAGDWPLPAVAPLPPSKAAPEALGPVGPDPQKVPPPIAASTPAAAPATEQQPQPAAAAPKQTWLELLFEEADRIKAVVAAKKAEIGTAKLPLPPADPPRTNLDLQPPRYDVEQYKASTVYYWKYVYNATSPNRPPEFTTNCGKRPGQKYWIATYAAGEKRQHLARTGLKPTCLQQGADEVVIWTPDDLDTEYKRRNADILGDPHGVGNWIWKHYVQYSMLERMGPDDVFFYMDSDMNCTSDLLGYFCLADKNDVTPFHHDHPWYSLARLSRRDAMVFMGMDREGVAHSVQYSGGNVFYKKTPRAVQYVRELAAWSQQPEVVRGYGSPSQYSEDWPDYAPQRIHQCDQAVSSILIMKYGWKSYPWVREGFGGGSDDARNAAERAECGMPLQARIRLDNLDKRR